jgi:hypothetical protein
MGSGEEGV